MNSTFTRFLLLGLFVFVLLPNPLFADDQLEEESSWGVTATVGAYSEYIFRGKNVYEGTSIQPSLTAFYDLGDYGTISANGWMHVSGETREPPEKFTELDGTFSYDLEIDIVRLSVGHIMYRFPGDTGRIADTNEYFAAIALDIPTHPSVTFYNDYDEGEYQYYTLGFRESFTFDSADNLLLTPYAQFAFATNANDNPTFYLDSGLVHIDFGLNADILVGPVVVSPSINMTLEADDYADNEFWFGIDLSYDI